uniref:Thioredoxin domain-containing protein n=1 Tax=Panagrellus redivivus TaxID=6233 RepID=A0A7E4W720_PANRE
MGFLFSKPQPTQTMSLWEGVTVVDADGNKHSAPEYLKDKVVAIYFSAGWCPPCRAFTPKLKKFYEALKEANQNFEVVFISRDRSAEDLVEYYKDHHGKWLYVEYNPEFVDAWRAKFDVKTIPALKVVKPDGTVVVQDARTEVAQKGGDAVALLEEWKAFL